MLVPFEDPLYEQLCKENGLVKRIYQMIVEENNSGLDHLYGKLSKRYVISKEALSKALGDIYKVTNITKYRNYQYRLLASSLPANDRLFHWGIKSSQSCEWCGFAKQTLFHLFVSMSR